MPDQVALDVIDRPVGGVLRAYRQLRVARHAGAPGMRAMFPLGTARFVDRVRPAPTPRRIGVLTVWDSDRDLEPGWSDAVGTLCDGAREHWHVRSELARASFSEPWKNWSPDPGENPLADEEPALIVISGELRPRYTLAFLQGVATAVGQAVEDPGYLGGLGIQGSLTTTVSCSAWRSYGEAKEYAFGSGGHADVVRRDRREGHHTTEWFLRLRPLVERGTLNGTAPFGSLLA